MRIMQQIGMFAAALVSATCAWAQDLQPTPAKLEIKASEASVPLYWVRNTPVVEVKINGKGPYRLIFDTGAPVILLTNKLAREAGVMPKSQKAPPFALFGSMGQFKIKSLELASSSRPAARTAPLRTVSTGELAGS